MFDFTGPQQFPLTRTICTFFFWKPISSYKTIAISEARRLDLVNEPRPRSLLSSVSMLMKAIATAHDERRIWIYRHFCEIWVKSLLRLLLVVVCKLWSKLPCILANYDFDKCIRNGKDESFLSHSFTNLARILLPWMIAIRWTGYRLAFLLILNVKDLKTTLNF